MPAAKRRSGSRHSRAGATPNVARSRRAISSRSPRHSGLIIALGEWVLRRACLDGKDWPHLTVAVNVSPLQFRRADFVDMVERILFETEFPGARLELEITETTLIGNVDGAEAAMRRLKALGVRL